MNRINEWFVRALCIAFGSFSLYVAVRGVVHPDSPESDAIKALILSLIFLSYGIGGNALLRRFFPDLRGPGEAPPETRDSPDRGAAAEAGATEHPDGPVQLPGRWEYVARGISDKWKWQVAGQLLLSIFLIASGLASESGETDRLFLGAGLLLLLTALALTVIGIYKDRLQRS